MHLHNIITLTSLAIMPSQLPFLLFSQLICIFIALPIKMHEHHNIFEDISGQDSFT